MKFKVQRDHAKYKEVVIVTYDKWSINDFHVRTRHEADFLKVTIR